MDFFKELIENAKAIITQKYFCFEGRAGRKEFWQWVLAIFVINFVIGLIPVVQYLAGLILLAALLPTLGVTARRLHDVGKTGWLQVISIFVIGIIIVLILCIPEGDKEANQYGEPVK